MIIRIAGKIATIRKFGQLLEEEYTDEGIRVKAYVPSDCMQCCKMDEGDRVYGVTIQPRGAG